MNVLSDTQTVAHANRHAEVFITRWNTKLRGKNKGVCGRQCQPFAVTSSKLILRCVIPVVLVQ